MSPVLLHVAPLKRRLRQVCCETPSEFRPDPNMGHADFKVVFGLAIKGQPKSTAQSICFSSFQTCGLKNINFKT